MILLNLYFAFDEFLGFIFANTPASIFARIVILSQYFDKPVSLRYQPKAQVTPEMIFAELQKVIQSKDTFKLDGGLKIHVLLCDPPSGTGKGVKRSLNDGVEFRKRSLKEICKHNEDYLCLSRALIIGKALVDHPDPKDLTRVYHLRERPCAGIYDQQVILHEAADVAIEKRLYSLVDVDKFQIAMKDYRIFVFERSQKIECIYKGPPANKNIYLLMKNNHYHLITDINKYAPHKHYFCTVCGEFYSATTSYKHFECKNICKACEHSDCIFEDKKDEGSEWLKCNDCNRFWRNKKCFENHLKPAENRKKSICELKKKCGTCGLTLKRQMFDQFQHVCFEKFCRFCKQKYHGSTEQHQCNIPPLKFSDDDLDYLIGTDKDKFVLKKIDSTKTNHYFYDIETNVVDGVHEPILVMMQDVSGYEKAFYGVECINNFCKEIFSPQYENSIFISHGGKNYDNFFPLNYCYKNNIRPKVLFNGGQILALQIPDFKIEFKDNLSFLTVPLAKLPETMGLDLNIQKGFFPYMFPYPYTTNCIRDLPPKEMYCVGTMKKERREEFDRWYRERQQSGEQFDYFSELTTYCSQDVNILRLAANKFRRLILEVGCIDPYIECITLAQLCSKIYRKLFLQKNTIGIIPHHGYNHAKRYSVKAIKYYEYLMSKDNNLKIRHQLNGGEVLILDKYYVDGFVEKAEQNKKGEIHEFAGCFFHGHPCKYFSQDKNSLNGICYGDLYDSFLERIHDLENNNFSVKVMWECEYDRKYKSDEEFRLFIDRYELEEGLKPGDALFGGRNEVFSLYHKTSPEETMSYVDFCSLYPAVMSKEKYPLRHPDAIKLNPDRFTDVSEIFGLIKAKILPPNNVPIAVLPYRNDKEKKVLYTLCKKCAVDLNPYPCLHTECERSWIGTYTSFELSTALNHGYKILKIYEIWEWKKQNQSSDIFKDYIKTFFRLKIACGGFPSSCCSEEEKEIYIEQINRENDLTLVKKDIEKNPGMKNVAKRLINSLWGKLAVKPGRTDSIYTTDPEEFFKILREESYDIQDIFNVNRDMIFVSYLVKNKHPGVFTNVVIASMVTSYARCWLFNKCIAKLCPWQIHYVDTDSIIYSSRQQSSKLVTGSGLGDLTDEIESMFGVQDSIGEWCATGNKSFFF